MSTRDDRMRNTKLKQKRRLRKRQLLADLKIRASLIDATKSDIAAYQNAVKEREGYLVRERKRKKIAGKS